MDKEYQFIADMGRMNGGLPMGLGDQKRAYPNTPNGCYLLERGRF